MTQALTRREREVLSRVALAETNAEIARRLGISPWTVHQHLSAIYQKLGVRGRLGAVAKVWAERGWAR